MLTPLRILYNLWPVISYTKESFESWEMELMPDVSSTIEPNPFHDVDAE